MSAQFQDRDVSNFTQLARNSGWTYLFVALTIATFYGDVAVRYVVPLAALLLPLIAVYGLWLVGVKAFRPTLGLALMLGLAATVLVQAAQGLSPAKQDLSLYLPVAYSLLVLFLLSKADVKDDGVWRGLVIGTAVTAMLMCVMIFFVPRDVFLIPGQMTTEIPVGPKQAEPEHEPVSGSESVSSYSETSASSDLPTSSPAESAPVAPEVKPLGSEEIAYYDNKNLARNALGRSNYIAVFLVFAFAVAMFRGSWAVAVVIAGAIYLTQSRSGFLAAGVAVPLAMLVHRLRIPFKVILVTGLLLLATIAVVAWLFWDRLPSSLLVRGQLLSESARVLASHTFFGAPRSVRMEEFGVNELWSPHSSVATLVMNFGLVGLAAYAAYVGVALNQFYRLATNSRLWAGVFFAFVIIFAWSLLEIIVMTPAFEILLASFYAVARARTSGRLASAS